MSFRTDLGGTMTAMDVQTYNEQWQKAFANHDVEELLSLYSEDARVLAPGAPPMQGKRAFREFANAMLEAGAKSCDLNSVDTIQAGDIIVDVGTYRMVIDPPGGGRVEDVGKYVDVLRRQPDGSLKIVVDTFNSDAPAPA